MGQERTPAYWAVLPAKVRYDRELRPNAKLLYAEITALADATGFCWASNDYLGQLFGLSKDAVKRLISSLAKKGYLTVEVVRDPQTQEVKERRIWVDRPGGLSEIEEPEKAEPSGTNIPDPSGTNIPDPSGTKIPIEQSKINFNNTPYNPPEGEGAGEAEKKRRGRDRSSPTWRPEDFERFWDAYPRHADRRKAVRAWDTLRPDDTMLERMSRGLYIQLSSPMWKRGIGIPYPATWLNGARWEDDLTDGPAQADDREAGRQWADDPEVY